jgi:hypothetical protein
MTEMVELLYLQLDHLLVFPELCGSPKQSQFTPGLRSERFERSWVERGSRELGDEFGFSSSPLSA